MEPVGIDLKAAREEKNVTLREIATATRINLTHLTSIEEGRYGDLPGGIYNRAFLRAYCEYLGIEPQGYLDRYESEQTPPTEKIARHKPIETRHPGTEIKLHPLAIWATMLLVSVVGLYISRHWIAAVFSPYFSHSPVARINPQEVPGAAIGARQTPTDTNVSKPPAETLPGQPVTETAAAPIGAPGAPGQVRQPTKPMAPPPQIAGTIRLEFQVIQKCWVSVNSDGNRVLNRLLEPGDDQFFDATQRFYLILGNAGGIRLKINGKPAKSLGKSGDVVRLIINEQNLIDLLEKTTG